MYNDNDIEIINDSKYTLRPYQENAVKAGIEFFKEKKNTGAVMALPTGSGKSLIIASIAKNIEGNTLILQPSKEILEQNYKKAIDFGFKDIGIFSASCGRKDIGKITFATIGSIINRKELFSGFNRLITDECHLCNAKGGMYEEFIRFFGGKVLGLTATPYRLHSFMDMFTGQNKSVVKFLTRTRPRIFSGIIHITQIQEMYDSNFLCPIEYEVCEDYDQSQLKINSTGANFTEKSIKEYNESFGLTKKVIDVIKKQKRKHILVFCTSVKESEDVKNDIINSGIIAETISAKTPKKDREQILEMFMNGTIKVVLNVGTLTCGYDFPALDCVILGRPTKSVSLYQQMCGRGIRLHPEKENCKIVDMCGNVKVFGKIETFKIIDYKNKGLHVLASDTGQLTGVNIATKKTKLCDNGTYIMPWGKFHGVSISKIPEYYLKWCIDNLDNNYIKEKMINELNTRKKQ